MRLPVLVIIFTKDYLFVILKVTKMLYLIIIIFPVATLWANGTEHYRDLNRMFVPSVAQPRYIQNMVGALHLLDYEHGRATSFYTSLQL